jgi:hypothetical protein
MPLAAETSANEMAGLFTEACGRASIVSVAKTFGKERAATMSRTKTNVE